MFSKDIFGETIYAYTRAQAIADGELADVTEAAQEARFRIPVALTRDTWLACVEWTDDDTIRQTYQDESGRLWDVIWMLYMACLSNRKESCILYWLYVVPRDGKSSRPVKIQLKAVIGGGDNGEAVITIMLPDED